MKLKQFLIERAPGKTKSKKQIIHALEDALVDLGWISHIDELSKYENDAIKLQKKIQNFLKKIN